MTRIRIPVRNAGNTHTPLAILQILFGGFVLGLIVGVGYMHPAFLVTPRDPSINVASVGESTTNSEKIFAPAPIEQHQTQADREQSTTNTINNDENQVSNDSPSEEWEDDFSEILLVQDDTNGEVAGATDTAPTSSFERTTTIERLSREIAQLKNSSVEIIIQFNQNCGSWTDACALPYATQLEKNNSAYDALAKELDLLQR